MSSLFIAEIQKHNTKITFNTLVTAEDKKEAIEKLEKNWEKVKILNIREFKSLKSSNSAKGKSIKKVMIDEAENDIEPKEVVNV